MSLRWLLAMLIALLVFSAIGPWLEKIGLGRLPGDLRFRLFDREWFVPLASSVLLSLLGMAIVRWL